MKTRLKGIGAGEEIAALLSVACLGILVALMVVASPAYGSPASPSAMIATSLGIEGDALTGLLLVDLDPEQQAVVITNFYHQAQGGPFTVTRSHIDPEKSGNLYLPAESIPRGIHSAVAASNRSIAAVAYTNWMRTRAFAGYESARPALDVLVPFVVHAGRGQRTQVTVQNTDQREPTQVMLSFHDMTGRLVASSQVSLEAGMSRSFYPGEVGAPDGFQGSLRLGAAHPIAASVFMEFEDRESAVAAFQAVPVAHAADRLFAPEVSEAVEIRLSNPGDVPISVDVFYRRNVDASGDACAMGGAERAHFGSAVNVPAMGGLTVKPADRLAPGCAASAVIRSSGPSLAVALVRAVGKASASAYNLSSMEEAGQDLVLPLYRNRHAGSEFELTTVIDAMNLAEITATLSLEVGEGFSHSLTPIDCDACTVELGPGASYRFDPGVVPGLRDHVGMFGMAVLRSDQPVIAVVEDQSLTGFFDTLSYRGLAMCSASGGPAPRYCVSESYFPWTSRGFNASELRERSVFLPAVFAP